MVKALTSPRRSPAAARPDRFAGVLETAVRRHARIDLELESAVEPVSAQATILSLAGSVLTLQLRSGANLRRLSSQPGPLRARFTIDGRRFEFDAEFAEEPVVARENLLALRRPVALRTVERRRVARRRLQGSTVVRIRPDGVGNAVEAGLLNLSDFGLACRITRGDAERLRAGTPVRAAFQLKEAGADFELSARVANLTSASDGMWIAGLEFDRTPLNEAPMNRLRAALGAPSNAERETAEESSIPEREPVGLAKNN